MAVRIATFNIENLLTRFDFSGFRNHRREDRVTQLLDVENEDQYHRLEEARVVSLTDDTRQLTALAIEETDADILCLQEVESLEALNTFEDHYLRKMMGAGYPQKILIDGNDGRGINIGMLLRDRTRAGEAIEVGVVKSHAGLTFEAANLFTPAVGETELPDNRIFRRDCLEVHVTVGGKPLDLYVTHFKSMTSPRNGMDGRMATMPLRTAEALAIRQIIEQYSGEADAHKANFVICGDMNDYQEKLDITGDRRAGYVFTRRVESQSALSVFSNDGFAENPMLRRPEADRWTLYHTRGPDERHLCQLDYIWLSPSLSLANLRQVPEIIRNGQPYRTIFPQGQDVPRYPRTGWDRPKASDHCPVVIELVLP